MLLNRRRIVSNRANSMRKKISWNCVQVQVRIDYFKTYMIEVLTYIVGLGDGKRHVERVGQMVLRVQRWRAAVRRSRVHGLLLLLATGHGRVAGGVGRLDGQSGHRWPGGERVDGAATAAADDTSAAGGGGGGGRLVRVELQPERGGQRRRGHVATVVLGTADGRRADPATPGIRRLVHRPGGVLTHWRRDGCGQPVPGMINARRPYAGQRVLVLVVLQPAATSSFWPRPPTTMILCRSCSATTAATTSRHGLSYAARTRVIVQNTIYDARTRTAACWVRGGLITVRRCCV